MLAIFAATYAAVFVAEIVGDKLLYTTGVLAANYRSVSIVVGMAFAHLGQGSFVGICPGGVIDCLPLIVEGRQGIDVIALPISLRIDSQRALEGFCALLQFI